MGIVVLSAFITSADGDLPSVLKSDDGMEMFLVETSDFVMGTGQGSAEEFSARVSLRFLVVPSVCIAHNPWLLRITAGSRNCLTPVSDPQPVRSGSFRRSCNHWL